MEFREGMYVIYEGHVGYVTYVNAFGMFLDVETPQGMIVNYVPACEFDKVKEY